jgi:putative ABC transport system ATP-binding protein/lipoprotein-releasing system ATP-binding protein
MIALKEVTKTYPIAKTAPVQAVRGVSLQIERGEFVIITGRSGSGKTTLLNLAAGLTRPSSGSVFFEGADLHSLTEKERARLRSQKVGFVFQFPSLLPSLTVLENVQMPAIFANGHAPNGSGARAVELLKAVGLADKLGAYPRQLSAGQQQRVVIARALINQPDLLVADEPTSDLDEQTEQEIMQLFKRFFIENGLTILMVTHTSELLPFGTRALEMAGGVFKN